MIELERKRRSIRLLGADYSEPGAYFVTICAAGRKNLFGKIENGHLLLNALGRIVQECWVEIPNHFPTATLKEFVIMPNHFHAIIALGAPARPILPSTAAVAKVGARYIVPCGGTARTTESFQKPTKASLPTIVRAFKAAVTRSAKDRIGKPALEIWQRNYFERVLRDGKEYLDASRYILENPKKWAWDKQNLQATPLPSGKGNARFE